MPKNLQKNFKSRLPMADRPHKRSRAGMPPQRLSPAIRRKHHRRAQQGAWLCVSAGLALGQGAGLWCPVCGCCALYGIAPPLCLWVGGVGSSCCHPARLGMGIYTLHMRAFLGSTLPQELLRLATPSTGSLPVRTNLRRNHLRLAPRGMCKTSCGKSI